MRVSVERAAYLHVYYKGMLNYWNPLTSNGWGKVRMLLSSQFTNYLNLHDQQSLVTSGKTGLFPLYNLTCKTVLNNYYWSFTKWCFYVPHLSFLVIIHVYNLITNIHVCLNFLLRPGCQLHFKRKILAVHITLKMIIK